MFLSVIIQSSSKYVDHAKLTENQIFTLYLHISTNI